MKNAKPERFKVTYSEGSALDIRRMILTDTVTGVSYLTVSGGYGLAITPLIGADGKPLIGEPDQE